MDKRLQEGIDELRKFVRRKIEVERAFSPSKDWEAYYKGRLSAFEDVDAAIRWLGL